MQVRCISATADKKHFMSSGIPLGFLCELLCIRSLPEALLQPSSAHRACDDLTTEEIIMGVKGHSQGGWGANIIPHSGTGVYINKPHLIFVQRVTKFHPSSENNRQDV